MFHQPAAIGFLDAEAHVFGYTCISNLQDNAWPVQDRPHLIIEVRIKWVAQPLKF